MRGCVDDMSTTRLALDESPAVSALEARANGENVVFDRRGVKCDFPDSESNDELPGNPCVSVAGTRCPPA